MASGDSSTWEDPKDPDGWRVEEPDEAKYNFSDEKGFWCILSAIISFIV